MPISVRLYSNFYGVLKQLILLIMVNASIAGAGLILQPTFIINEALTSGKLVIVLPELEPEALGLYVVYAHRKLLPHKVRCFIDFMEGYYGTPPYWDDCMTKS